MMITYDKSVDAAYIYLDEANAKKAGWVKKTYSCDANQVNGMINLDFDADQILYGIEVLDASKKLPQSLLEAAELIG